MKRTVNDIKLRLPRLDHVSVDTHWLLIRLISKYLAIKYIIQGVPNVMPDY